MEVQQVRYFVALAKELNFTRAAAVCHVAQPSLSQQIRKLENELGGPLFHRLGRRVLLTDLGEALLPRAKSLLQLHQETLHEAKERSTESKTVRFGTTLTIAPYLLPALASEIKRSKLDCEFRISEDFTENLLTSLREGRLDFAILVKPIDDPALLCHMVKQEAFLAVVPHRHRLSKHRKIKLQDLLREPFLALSSIHCAGRQINEICSVGKPGREPLFHCTQIETILRLVAQGSGVSILPEMALSKVNTTKIASRPLQDSKAGREILMAHHKDRYLGKPTRAAMDVVGRVLCDL